MKRLTLGFLLLLFSVATAQIVGPKISYQESNYDFGDVSEGDIVVHDFEIYNTGGDVLKINHVRASCGCTAVKPEKDVLEPGEATTIKVSFNTARRKGKQRKHVYVLSNDPEILKCA
jgi:hypothetical protein